MAINRVSGNILQDNLQRGANLSIQGNLIYFDVTGNRVGVLTNSPQDQFNVIGVANASNVRITSATANSIFYAGADQLALTTANLTWDGTALNITGNIIATAAIIGNITINSTSIISDANLSISTSANGNISLSPNGNGVTQINSTTALTVPTGNTIQRPSSPDQGAIRFNTVNLELEVYDGTQWETVGADIAAITDQTLAGDGSTVNFNLDQISYANAIIVSTNGVVQKPNVAYTVSGNIITFTEAPAVSDIIDVRFIAEVEQVTAISNSAGNAFIQVDTSGVGNLSTVQSLQLPTYTANQANALPNTASGQMIYVSDGDSGSPCLAVYSIDAWKIVQFGGNITP